MLSSSVRWRGRGVLGSRTTTGTPRLIAKHGCWTRRCSAVLAFTMALHVAAAVHVARCGGVVELSRVNPTPASELEALMQFYNETHGPLWKYNGGWGHGDPCSPSTPWSTGVPANNGQPQRYVGCADVSGTWHITTLLFYDNNLGGTIPTCLTRLPYLTELEIYVNGMTGTIPPALGQLTHLRTLTLGGDRGVAGTVPSELGALLQLESLDLQGMSIGGTVPASFSNLTQLTYLGIHGNSGEWRGGLPDLSKLVHLTMIRVYNNGMGGKFPVEIGQMVNLTSVVVAGQSFHGTLPSLANLTRLTTLQVEGTAVGGTIPTDIDAASKTLETISLASNRLVGTVPASLGGLTNVKSVNLRGNSLQDGVSAWLYKMASLTDFDASDNLLDGAAPSPCAGTPGGVPATLQSLKLKSNRLSSWVTTCTNVDAARLGSAGGVSTTLAEVNLANNSIGNAVGPLDGSNAITSLDLSDNPRLQISDLRRFVFNLKQAVSLDVSNTNSRADGVFVKVGSPGLPNDNMRSLRVRDCREMRGSLPEDSGRGGLVVIDIRGTRLSAPHLPSYITTGSVLQPYNESVMCYPAVSNPADDDFVAVWLDPSYDAWARCQCAPGFAGVRATCLRCDLGTWSAGNAATCTPCPPGSYQRDLVGTRGSPDTCTSCPPGSAAPNAGTGGRCSSCGPGTISSRGASGCSTCGAGTYAAGGTACITCQPDYYAQPGSSKCFRCPAGTSCGTGTAVVHDGVWWPGNLGLGTARVANTYPCLTPTSCSAGAQPNSTAIGNATVRCGEGSTGPLCAMCTVGYARASLGLCERCSALTSLVAGIVACCAAAVFLLFAVRRKLRRRGGGGASEPGRGAASKSFSSGRGVLRTLVSFLQMTSLAGEFRLRGSAMLHAALSSAGGVGGDSVAHAIVAPLDCAFNVGFLGQLVAAALLPVVATGMAATWIGWRTGCGARPGGTCAHDLTAACGAIGFLLYTRLARVALSAFKTHAQPVEGVVYLEADFRVTTSDDVYAVSIVVAAAMLVIYSVSLPVLAFTALRRVAHANAGSVARGDVQGQRRSTNTDRSFAADAASLGAMLLPAHERVDLIGAREVDTLALARDASSRAAVRKNELGQHPLAMLSSGYCLDVWWWEATVLARKLGFAALSVFVDDRDAQSLIAALLLFGLTCLQIRLKPYAEDRLNNAETLSLAALFVTVMGSLAYAHVDVAQGESGAAVLTVALLVVNGAVVALLLRLLVAEVPWRRWCPCSTSGRAARKAARSIDAGLRFEGALELGTHSSDLRD